MVNAAFERLSQCHGHVQRSDRQIPFHAVTDGPTDDAAGIQIEDNGQIQPALTGPDIGYVASPFLIGAKPSMVRRYQVYPSETRLSVSGGHNGLGDAQGFIVAIIEHDGRQLLQGSFE